MRFGKKSNYFAKESNFCLMRTLIKQLIVSHEKCPDKRPIKKSSSVQALNSHKNSIKLVSYEIAYLHFKFYVCIKSWNSQNKQHREFKWEWINLYFQDIWRNCSNTAHVKNKFFFIFHDLYVKNSSFHNVLCVFSHLAYKLIFCFYKIVFNLKICGSCSALIHEVKKKKKNKHTQVSRILVF